MAKAEIIKEWLKQADEDFNFASASLQEHDSFFSRICFHFQQAAEKYLKAYIIANKLGFEKVHNLKKLLSVCQQEMTNFKDLKADCIFLNAFYIDTRYPAFWPIGNTKKEAEKAKQSAKKIGDFVKNKLKKILS